MFKSWIIELVELIKQDWHPFVIEIKIFRVEGAVLHIEVVSSCSFKDCGWFSNELLVNDRRADETLGSCINYNCLYSPKVSNQSLKDPVKRVASSLRTDVVVAFALNIWRSVQAAISDNRSLHLVQGYHQKWTMDHLKVYDHFGIEQARLELRMLRVELPKYLRVF